MTDASSTPTHRTGESTSHMRAFTILWIGQMLSLFCSGMTCFAQTIFTYTNLAGTITHLAILTALAQLPGILVSPLAGLLADRWSRRGVMILCNSVAALATLWLRWLVVHQAIQIWHIYVLVTIIATANAVQWPAYFATIPTMVPFKRIGRANAMVQTARTLSQLAAPAIAAWLIHSIRMEGIVLFDMASYLLAAAILFSISVPPPPARANRGLERSRSLWHETFRGWAYLLARPGLTGVMILLASANFVYAGAIIVILPLTLTLADVDQYGMLMTVCGISAAAGSFLTLVWAGPERRIYGVLGALAIVAIGLALTGIRPNLLFVFAGFTLVTFAMPFVNTASGIVWQTKVPLDMQGRVMAATGMVAMSAFEVGYLLAGVAADGFFVSVLLPGTPLASLLGGVLGTGKGPGLGLMMFLMGGVLLASVAGGFLYPRLRRIDHELPDAVLAFAESQVDGQAVGTTWRQIDLTRA